MNHLTLVDDTIIFIEANVESMLNVRRILRCFEIGSGFKINFHKSGVVKVGKGSCAVDMWVELFRCKQVSRPIIFLWLPFRGNSSSIGFWETMLEKFRSRLVSWKMHFISKVGCLVLIKSVLASLTTYFLSVFKIMKVVAMTIEKLQRDFFWGIKRDMRNIHLVYWPSFCKNC
ncbi:hypothetical protein Ddye_013920 [Dipteronia dyeriana]|uniref:Reverse transcriptase domain-containing protein n=1 Tax=Dipteronia dyeriana TaxID=168575 RepID=A0AAD9X765_9ROSI|nr:hypothetical protein Ddye_013920 [Dipteronia dyeriana]